MLQRTSFLVAFYFQIVIPKIHPLHNTDEEYKRSHGNHHRRSWVILAGGQPFRHAKIQALPAKIFSCQGGAKFADSVLPC